MSWWSKLVDAVTGTERKTVRARNDKGQYIGDDECKAAAKEANRLRELNVDGCFRAKFFESAKSTTVTSNVCANVTGCCLRSRN